jgi:ribosomal protein S18 acetylase RimI-like enzyme
MLRIDPVDPTQLHCAFREAFADYAMDASGTTEERLRLRMQKNRVDYALSPGLYNGDRLVGFTLIGIDDWGPALTAYDAGTGIVPDFRKQGWARKMFDHALPALRERGVKRFVLEVLQENGPAIKAYRKSGFEIVRELRCFVARVEALHAVRSFPDVDVRPIDRAKFEETEAFVDWPPSFENRPSAIDALGGHVRLLGAFDGGTCVGGLAYSPPLNWLLALAVDRGFRRRGAGTALVHRLSATLPPAVTRLPILNVDGQDEGSQAFFRSLGFVPLVDQYEMARGL